MSRWIPQIPVLTLVSAEVNDIHLSWLDMSYAGKVEVLRYHVYRKIDTANWALLGFATGLTYIDTDIHSAGVPIYYRIQCEFSMGVLSDYSNIVTATLDVPDYVYLLGEDGKMHVLDIQTRTAPAFVGSQDFSAQFGTIQQWDRMLIDDIHLYVGCGLTGVAHTHVLNYASGVLDYRYKINSAQAKTSGILLRRNLSAISILVNYLFSSDNITGNDNHTQRNYFYVGSMLGSYHPDSIVYDPYAKKGHFLCAGDYSYSIRWGNTNVGDTDLVSQVAVETTPFTGIIYTDEGRQLVQQRAGQASLLWVLMDGGWTSYVLPAPYPTAAFSSFSPPDPLHSSDYGRCYLRGNYMYLCQKVQKATRYAVEIYDVTTPATPVRLTGLGGLNAKAVDILFVDIDAVKYAYVLQPTGKTILVYDITTVTSPSLLATVAVSQLSTNMCLIARANNTSQYDGGNGFMPNRP